MRNENHPRIICIQLLSEREEGVFKNDNAASCTLCGSVFKVLWYDGGAQVCVERCIYLFS